MPTDGRRFRLAALLTGVLLLIGPVGPSVQQTRAQTTPPAAEDAPDEPGLARLRAARLTLQNPSAPAEERRDAGALLLASDDPAIRAMLHRAILDDSPPGARRAIAEAAAAMPATPRFIAPALGLALERAHAGADVFITGCVRPDGSTSQPAHSQITASISALWAS